jgi:predicted anti-sigma-YlaC factor YlaD
MSLSGNVNDITCEELVELVTEYLEGALTAASRERIELHLAGCAGCRAHLEQVRVALRVASALPPERLSDGPEDELVAAFLSWANERRGV